MWNITRNDPVLELQESKDASVPGINKLKVIHDFISSNGRSKKDNGLQVYAVSFHLFAFQLQAFSFQ